MKFEFEILDEWQKERSIPELIALRTKFVKYMNSESCTCDTCILVTHCALAYDGYNTNGDCLYSK